MTGIYFEALGEKLKSIRQERNLTLREIADRTRIPLSNLEAIEAGNPERLPAPVFVKGFLRSYAIELGLDHTDVINEYKTFGAEPEAENVEVPVAARRPQFNELPKVFTVMRKILPLALGAVVVFLVIYFGAPPLYRVVKNWMADVSFSTAKNDSTAASGTDSGNELFSSASESPSTPVASLEPMPMAEVEPMDTTSSTGDQSAFGMPSLPDTIQASDASVSPPSDPNASFGTSAGSEGTVFTMPQPVVIGDSTISNTAELPSDVGAGMETVAPGSGLASGVDTVDAVPTGPHELRLVFNKKSWVQIVVDDQDTQHGLYQPGQTNTWVAENRFFVRIGNAGGVQAYFDGRDLGRLGRPGGAVSLSLPKP